MDMEDALSKLVHKVGFDNFVADGNEVVEFKCVRSVEDLDKESLVFHPQMCHQIFGEGETVFGYENLKIKINFAAGSLKTYVGIKYSKKVSPTNTDGVEADNIVEKLDTVLRCGYLTNLDDFSACLPKEASSFTPPGELIHSFQKTSFLKFNGDTKPITNGHSSTEKTYEIYEADVTVPKFSEYHKRMESFTLWYIDAASLLDLSDERWRFFMIFEKYKTSEGDKHHAFVGYASIYEFYAYPDKIRPRIGQMLILPPFQKQGLGVELLSSIYNRYRKDSRAVEISVEDPSDDFELLRDYVDSADCIKLASYAPENLKTGFNSEMEKEAKDVLKLTKRQARRIYEILRLRNTNVEDEVEFKKFRLSVKERLNIPYKKKDSDIKRMMKRNINLPELEQVSQADDAARKTNLESDFQNLFTHYKDVIRRLDRYGS